MDISALVDNGDLDFRQWSFVMQSLEPSFSVCLGYWLTSGVGFQARLRQNIIMSSRKEMKICSQASLYLFTVLPQCDKCHLSYGGSGRQGENLGLTSRRSEESQSSSSHRLTFFLCTPKPLLGLPRQVNQGNFPWLLFSDRRNSSWEFPL